MEKFENSSKTKNKSRKYFTKSEKYFQDLNIEILKKERNYSKEKFLLTLNLIWHSISLILSIFSILIFIAKTQIFSFYLDPFTHSYRVLFFINFGLTHIFFLEFLYFVKHIQHQIFLN